MSILENDPRMKVCALRRFVPHVCSPKIDWHHNLIFAGKQSDIPETIIALCDWIHDIEKKPEIKELLNWIMLNQMSDDQVKSISKAVNYARIKETLNSKYGHYKP